MKHIEVGEKYEIVGETYRDIKINYNFSGMWNSEFYPSLCKVI